MRYEVLEYGDGNTLAQIRGDFKSKILAIEEARSAFRLDKRIRMIQVENMDTGRIVYEKIRRDTVDVGGRIHLAKDERTVWDSKKGWNPKYVR